MFLAFFVTVAVSLVSSTQELRFLRGYKVNSVERFDLSGILLITPEISRAMKVEGDFLLVNDKSSKLWIGEISNSEMNLKAWIDLKTFCGSKKFDLEDLAFFQGNLFIANEADGMIFEIKSNSEIKCISSPKLYPKNFKPTPKFGLEAIAAGKDFIITGNEMPPLQILKIKSEPLQLLESFQRETIGSQTSLRLNADSLYLLDRENRTIWKRNLKTKVETAFSFEKILHTKEYHYPQHDEKKLERPEWGTAEALDFNQKEIFIGLDNNGEKLKDSNERRPSVLVFERPKDF